MPLESKRVYYIILYNIVQYYIEAGMREDFMISGIQQIGINQASNIAVALREEYHIFCSVVKSPDLVLSPDMPAEDVVKAVSELF